MATTDVNPAIISVGGYRTSFTRRFFAWCIDTPIRFVIGLAAVFVPMRSLVLSESEKYGSPDPNYLRRAMSSTEKAVIFLLWLVAGMIVPWLYTAVQESSSLQATLGERLLDLKVIGLDGQRISVARASGRFFCSLIPSLGIGYGIALFTPGNRHCTISLLVAWWFAKHRDCKTSFIPRTSHGPKLIAKVSNGPALPIHPERYTR